MTNARIDSLTYEYYPKTNQLRRIVDYTSHSMEDAFGDLTTQTDTVTYEYDAIGQLVIDRAENQRIVWNPDHTVKEVRALDTDRLKLAFVYDDKGNRVQKRTYKTDGSLDKTTYYFRDLEGNVMGVYNQQNDTLRATEHTVYANGRLGLANRDTAGVTFTYELTDHLGNVRAVVDRKTLNAAAGGDTSGVSPEVAMMADYYPFGWEMPGRKRNEDDYRYGFNGKETDPETGWQDYGFRIYNPRVARFFRVDPYDTKFPYLSPYQFAGNMVVVAIDLEGLEPYRVLYYGGAPVSNHNNTFQVTALNLRREYRKVIPNYNINMTEIVSARQFIEDVNSYNASSIERLDIFTHGSPFALHIYENLDKSQNSGLYTFRIWASLIGDDKTGRHGTVGRINFDVFTANARVELHGCNAGANLWIMDSFAEEFSEQLYAAGKTKAVVIAHLENSIPNILGGNETGPQHDYRHGIRAVFWDGYMLFKTDLKREIPQARIDEAIRIVKAIRDYD